MKIICVRCDSNSGIINAWKVFFSNGNEEEYIGEVPPMNISRFCRKAKYGYKDFDGDFMTDWYCNDSEVKPLKERKNDNV